MVVILRVVGVAFVVVVVAIVEPVVTLLGRVSLFPADLALNASVGIESASTSVVSSTATSIRREVAVVVVVVGWPSLSGGEVDVGKIRVICQRRISVKPCLEAKNK